MSASWANLTDIRAPCVCMTATVWSVQSCPEVRIRSPASVQCQNSNDPQNVDKKVRGRDSAMKGVSDRLTQEILIIINEKNVKVFQNCPKLLQIFKLANCFNISKNCIFFLFSKLLELSIVFLKIVKNWYYFALFDKSVKVFQNCKKIQNCKNCQIVKLLSK